MPERNERPISPGNRPGVMLAGRAGSIGACRHQHGRATSGTPDDAGRDELEAKLRGPLSARRVSDRQKGRHGTAVRWGGLPEGFIEYGGAHRLIALTDSHRDLDDFRTLGVCAAGESRHEVDRKTRERPRRRPRRWQSCARLTPAWRSAVAASRSRPMSPTRSPSTGTIPPRCSGPTR